MVLGSSHIKSLDIPDSEVVKIKVSFRARSKIITLSKTLHGRRLVATITVLLSTALYTSRNKHSGNCFLNLDDEPTEKRESWIQSRDNGLARHCSYILYPRPAAKGNR